MNSIVFFGLVTAFNLQDNPQKDKKDEPKNAPQITFSGSFDLKYSFWDGVLVESASNLSNGFRGTESGSAGSKDSEDAFFGRLTLRLDTTVGNVRFFAEAETKSVDQGSLQRFGIDDLDRLNISLEQAFIVVEDWICKGTRLQLGVQDVVWKLRPHGESMFMDITESESFYEGANTNITQFRNTVYRDTSEPVGLRLSYKIENAPWLTLDAYIFKVLEDGSPQLDEQFLAIRGGITPSDRTYAQLIVALVKGGRQVAGISEGKGQNVLTYGLGLDQYIDDLKKIEVFADVYLQSGTLRNDSDLVPATLRKKIDKDAFAYNFGLRGNILQNGSFLWWAEISRIRYSGDNNPLNSEDNSFQSYENVNQFIILEDKEVGLDIDTNYKGTKITIGADNIFISEKFKDISLRLDAGRFDLDKLAHKPGQTTLIQSNEKKLGVEYDLTVNWAYTKELAFQLKAAMLDGSQALDVLSRKSEKNANLLLLGCLFKW